MAPFPVIVWVPSLSLSLVACTYWLQLSFASFGWYVIPAGHFPQKSPSKNLKIGFFPFPTTKPCPLTSDPWPHHVLYWLGTGWWSLGLVRAFLPRMSKIYLLLMRLPWLACTVCRLFFTIFWFPFPLWLALLRYWVLLNGGLCSSLAHHFSATPFYHTTLSFLLWSCLPQSCWASLSLPFILLPMTQYIYWFFYYITDGLLCPICFPLGILGPFAFLELPRPFS